ncbi:hypothetical protein JCM10207_002485 [Rhodosporidiobolus poonsookiae]
MPVVLPSLFYDLPRMPAVAVGLPLAFGMASGFITQRSVNTWYDSLRKPVGEPPRWAFPAAWTCLYLGMGYASHLLVNVHDSAPLGSALRAAADTAIKLYWGQFALNMAWTPLFFGARAPLVALLDISLLTPLTYLLTAKAYELDPRTVYVFGPYCAWLTYATYLNGAFWWLNSGKKQVEKKDL